jgi:hypothetical protein
MMGERFVEGGLAVLAPLNLLNPVELQGLQNLGNQVEIVVRYDAAGIANLIANAGVIRPPAR